MGNMMTTQPVVTILIPQYKTLQLTKLCLRLLNKYTDMQKVKVIVIDNNSQDESVEYLRSLKWIKLIERKPETDDTPPLSHSRALDLALQYIKTPYVLSIHTDTMIKHDKWLDFLLKHIENNSQIGSIGSWKLESKPFYRRLAKGVEKYIQLAWYKTKGKKEHAIQGMGKNYYYLRSHCALYRMDLIQKYELTFSAEAECAGKVMHKRLKDAGYEAIFLPSEELGQYIDHINHATTVLNPELGSRKKSITQGEKRIQKALKKLKAEEILANTQLDEGQLAHGHHS